MKRGPRRIDPEILVELPQRVLEPAAIEIHRRQHGVCLQRGLRIGAPKLRAKLALGVSNRGVPAGERRGHRLDVAGEPRAFVAVGAGQRSVERQQRVEERLLLRRGASLDGMAVSSSEDAAWSNARSLHDQRTKRDAADNALALADGEDVIRRQTLDGLRRAARPPDLQAIGARRLAEAEVRAQIVLPQIAGPGLHLAHLALLPHRQRQPRTDRAAVALRRRSRARAMRVAALPPSFSSRFAAAPLLVISRSRSPSLSMSPAASAAAHQLGRKSRTGRFLHVHEPIAGVAQQQIPLRILAAGAELRRVGHHVAVGDGDVEAGVVVVVQEGHAEADVRPVAGPTPLPKRDIREQTARRDSGTGCASRSRDW